MNQRGATHLNNFIQDTCQSLAQVIEARNGALLLPDPKLNLFPLSTLTLGQGALS